MTIKGKTGEKVHYAGVYQNQYGKQVTLSSDSQFPPCPKEGKSIQWVKIDEGGH